MRVLGLMTSSFPAVRWGQLHSRTLQSHIVNSWDKTRESIDRIIEVPDLVKESLSCWQDKHISVPPSGSKQNILPVSRDSIDILMVAEETMVFNSENALSKSLGNSCATRFEDQHGTFEEVWRRATATFATGPRQTDTTLYEFRTYSVKPSLMGQFLQLSKEKIHLRTAHSELVGYWTVELGGLNKVFHIWKYDSFAHRLAVRAKLSQDTNWQESYISKAMPMVDKQHNEVAYLVPWCKLQKPEKEGVYEMVSFQFKPGGPAVWGNAFRAAISTHVNTGYTKLVGVFNTEYGLLNQVHVLWWNENADNRAAGRHLAHEDARVVAAVRESVQFLDSQRTVLLNPVSFSPLK
ncbi:protein NipSnap homolog 3A-like [Gastrophryne carolinensis]